MEKKPLHLVLTFWGTNQNKKTRNTMKSTLHCCKLQVIFKAKESYLICSDLKIMHLKIYCQEWFMITRTVDAILPIMEKLRDTYKLGLINIGISPLTFKRVPKLLQCDNFIVIVVIFIICHGVDCIKNFSSL